MRIIISVDLNDDEIAETEEQQELGALSPNEIGAAVIAFFNAMDAQHQVRSFELLLPWFNDDTQDICDVIKRDQSPLRIFTHQLRNMNVIRPTL